MNWYSTTGSGSVTAAGLRAADTDSMCGTAVMYGAVKGQILTLGGSPDYQNASATNAAHIITLGAEGSAPTVQTLKGMQEQRIFANSVVLPNGNVFVTGGQSYGQPFTDYNSSLTPEMWHYLDSSFHPMATNPTPRNYHSVAVLMFDGRIFNAGGGVCGPCKFNHLDAQVFSPPYLFNPDGSAANRPVITSYSPTTVAPGGVITIQSNFPLTSLALIRYGTSTHTVNTDQRRIGLAITKIGTNTYTAPVPSDPGIAVPGAWMLFAMNEFGVPSVSKTLMIN